MQKEVRKMKALAKTIIPWIVIILCVSGIFIYLYRNSDDTNAVQTENVYPGEWKVRDEYDTKGSGYEDFLKQKDSLKILNKVYKMLNSSDQYREYSEQYLTYYKYFDGDSGFTKGSSLNNKEGKQYLTNLRVYQMPEKYMQEKKIAENICKGRSFKKNEYQRSLDKVIPVIAGYEYQKIFKLNEKIKGGYPGKGNYTYQIVGFLKKDSKLESNKNLDKVLLLPTVIPGKDMKVSDQRVLMSIKCDGFFIYHNEKEWKEMVHLIKKIRRETGYRFVIPKTTQD